MRGFVVENGGFCGGFYRFICWFLGFGIRFEGFGAWFGGFELGFQFFLYLFSSFAFLNVEDAGGGMVFGGGEGAELFCFSVVGRGGRASVWGLVGGKVMLSGVFFVFFFGVLGGMSYL